MLALVVSTRTNGPTVSGQPVQGRAPLIYWESQDKQATVQNANGRFSIRTYIITSQNISFFYSLRSLQEFGPQVVAYSSNSSSGKPLSKPLKVSKVQSLGELGGFKVGLIQVNYDDITGQEISLEVTIPGVNTFAWQVSPLKQVATIGERKATHYHENQENSSDVTVFAPLLDDKAGTALKITLGDRFSLKEPALFYRVTSQGVVTSLTQTDFANGTAALPKASEPDRASNPVPRATEALIKPTPALP